LLQPPQQREEISVLVSDDRLLARTHLQLIQLPPSGKLLTTDFTRGIFFGDTMNNSRLFVGNLPYQTTDRDLQDHFSQAGVVTSCNIMMDKFTGRSRGFAFVEFSTPEEASKAVEQFHQKDFQGRALTVNIAQPREERAPRQGGGGFRGDRGDRGPRRDFGGERRERY
jgi:RNA recognition motif-containing protein